MEKYQLKLIPLSNLIISPIGPIQPICSKCCNLNCGHPIEGKSISVFGKIEKHRVHVGFDDQVKIVIQCEGFIENGKNKQK